MTECYPFLIPTLCRYEHFKELIESLQQSDYIKFIDLFIALDYPKNETHIDGYNKIKEYIEKGLEGFHKVKVFYRKTNYGPCKNYLDAVDYIFERYDNLILSEDDNIFSPAFLKFIIDGFIKYKDEPRVIGICGFSHPANWKNDGFDCLYSSTNISAWGYGIWKNKMCIPSNKRQYIENVLKDKKKTRKIRCCSKFIYYNLVSSFGKEEDEIGGDTAACIAMIVEDKVCVLPRISLVRNMGWDGSGVNCVNINLEKFPNYSQLPIYEEDCYPFTISDDLSMNEDNMKAIDDLYLPIYFPSKIRILALDFLTIVYRILGYKKSMILRKIVVNLKRRFLK